ncbi:ABC transporter substrate-binding protein [Nocardioides nitrophenolicus]|uniref:ABC transporter substrate-binding protein n=1 Tax=Nocardioides nitrophenolicus TaxID=60489 RepID=UPI001956B3A9|nr:ABC transporter substrate-binding protein [Nocardioides nitrophenolicus]MBM7519652.1 peptide/nickel transport system substrate-binding protein [Nocardioides nitrophenolicus]
MKTRISVRTRMAAALCATALAATACASSDDGDKDSSGAQASPKDLYKDGIVNPKKDPGTPVDGGTLRMAEYSEALVLDPTKTYPTGSTGLNVMASIYDTLMRYNPETQGYDPQLAEALSSDDNVTWTLSLRDGVKFTDGTPLDADAVVASIQRFITNRGLHGQILGANLKSMVATDTSTVTFTFNGAWARFPSLLAAGPGLILAPAAYADPASFKPIGAGPFVLESQSPGEKTVVKANEDYFGGRPHLDKIEFLQLGPDQTKLESLEAGEVDAVYVGSEKVVKDLVAKGYTGNMSAVSGVPTINFNHREGTATADVRVRQAIELAFDADTFLERTTGSDLLADRGLMGANSIWDTGVAPVETDAAAAKKLVDEAKADGFDGKLHYVGLSDAVSKSGAVAIKAMLDAVGFDVQLDLVSAVGDVVKKVYVDGDFDLARGSNSIPDSDPYAALDTAMNSTSGANPGRYASPEMDGLLAELRAADGPEEGDATLAKIEELWKKDAVYLNVGFGGFLEAWNDNVHGITPTTQTAVLFDDAWLGK